MMLHLGSMQLHDQGDNFSFHIHTSSLSLSLSLSPALSPTPPTLSPLPLSLYPNNNKRQGVPSTTCLMLHLGLMQQHDAYVSFHRHLSLSPPSPLPPSPLLPPTQCIKMTKSMPYLPQPAGHCTWGRCNLYDEDDLSVATRTAALQHTQLSQVMIIEHQ